MAPMRTRQELIHDISKLVESENEAHAACTAALDHLGTRDKAAMGGFVRTHQRHSADLSKAIARIGGTAPAAREALLTKGKVALGAALGEQAMLVAVKTSEDKLVDAYVSVAGAPMAPEIGAAIARCMEDQLRLQEWIDRRLHVPAAVGERVMDPQGENTPRASRPSHA